MKDLEIILKNNIIVGLCPETELELTMEYRGTTTIQKPQKHNFYMLYCPFCNKQHKHTEINYLRYYNKEEKKWIYLSMTGQK